MGATNCPETPRQRMIGMMYLVLTAMLALNVSKEILDAFVTVNDAMIRTNENFSTKILSTYESFRLTAENMPKAQEPYKKAEKVKAATEELIKYMEDMKITLHSIVDGVPEEEVRSQGWTLHDLQAKDNYDKTSTYFIGNPVKNDPGEAYTMMKKFEAYKQTLIDIVADKEFTKEHPILNSGLETTKTYSKDNATQDWAQHNFESTVAAACFTLLNKTIGEIRNIEYETIEFLLKAIDEKSHKFDRVEAKVIPNSRIVFQGDKYEATVIVAAYDSRQSLAAYWGTGRDSVGVEQQGSLTAVEGIGYIPISIPCSSVGDQKFAGYIRLKKPDGTEDIQNFNGTYSVTKPAAAVAADKMNVFYAGIPNPVSIAAPVAAEKLKMNWGGATAKPVPGASGKYELEVPSSLVGRDITIDVSAEMERGKPVQKLGSTVFRVKAVPEPNVFVGGNISAGKQPKDAILANPFISARMGVDFNYELKWAVLSYRVTFVKNGIEEAPITVTGPQFDGTIQNKIRSASSGTIVEFSDIKIRSIAGERNISKPIVIRIR